MTKLLVILLLLTIVVAVLSKSTGKNPEKQESKPNPHFARCEQIFSRDVSEEIPEDVYNCSHECLIYQKYHGGYADENGKCRCC